MQRPGVTAGGLSGTASDALRFATSAEPDSPPTAVRALAHHQSWHFSI